MNEIHHKTQSPLVKLLIDHGEFSDSSLKKITQYGQFPDAARLAMSCKALDRATHLRQAIHGQSRFFSNTHQHACEAQCLEAIDHETQKRLSSWTQEIQTTHTDLIDSLFPQPEHPPSEQSRRAMENVAVREITSHIADKWFELQLELLPKYTYVQPNKHQQMYQMCLEHFEARILGEWENRQRQALHQLATGPFAPVNPERIDTMIERQREIKTLSLRLRFHEIHPQKDNANEENMVADMRQRKQELEQQYLQDWANDEFIMIN